MEFLVSHPDLILAIIGILLTVYQILEPHLFKKKNTHGEELEEPPRFLVIDKVIYHPRLSSYMILPTHTCKRCSHQWIPRQKNVRVCPKCKSPYWNVERK